MSFKLYSVPDFKMTDSLWATIDQNKINLLASNNKLIKDNERFLTMGLSRKPDIYSCGVKQINTCGLTCLDLTGFGKVFKEAVAKARILRGELLKRNPELFYEKLFKEITALERKASKQGKKLAIRMNTLGDTAFPEWVFFSFPNVQFYDYTKRPLILTKYVQKEYPSNFHLTFSENKQDEANASLCTFALYHGVNVASIFDGKILPKTWANKEVIDGDTSDLRFLDKRGVIVGLKFKS